MELLSSDANDIRFAHIQEMIRLKGGETHGDMGQRTIAIGYLARRQAVAVLRTGGRNSLRERANADLLA